MNMKKNEEKRAAFVCDTAYQLFNMMTLYRQLMPQNADLYLCDFFPKAHLAYRNICKKHFFQNVVLMEPHMRREGEKRLQWYFRHAKVYLHPDESLEQGTIENPIDFHGYDKLYTCTMNYVAVCLLHINKNARLFLVEDGAGSYFSNSTSDSVSWRHRLFSFFFQVGADAMLPDAIYLHNIEHKETKAELCPLSVPDADHINLMQDIFEEYPQNENDDVRCIWLTHPDAFGKSTNKLDQQIAQIMREYADKLIVRRHPRDERSELYHGFLQDDTQIMWELQLPEYKLEEIVLIGIYSTAQMTPKLLYDKEPTVIFLERIYKTIYPYGWRGKILQSVRDFRASYRAQEKVLEPNTIEELKAILKEILG